MLHKKLGQILIFPHVFLLDSCMKGMVEEYGSVVVAVIIGLGMIAFLMFSVSSPQGVLHRFAVVSMEGMGAKTKVIVEEWTIGDVKAVLKDDGGLYLSGNGTLPSYSSVEETPWAEMSEHIDFVKVGDGVTITGEVPVN